MGKKVTIMVGRIDEKDYFSPIQFLYIGNTKLNLSNLNKSSLLVKVLYILAGSAHY
jgi:hypothetical protein